LQRFPAHRNKPLFIPLADYPDNALQLVHVRNPHLDQFAHPQTGRVQQIEHGPVPQARNRIRSGRFQQLIRLRPVQVLGQTEAYFGRRQQFGGIRR
jgi:hypothetical protein